MKESPRAIRPDDIGRNTPIYAVWELTLRCDHACSHCGSRAGKARPDELDSAELIEVAADLVRLGTREVTLIGGEAYLHPDIFDITRFLAAAGIRVGMQTGGRGLTLPLAKRLREAGMKAIGVSMDGPEEAHDTLRASKGSQRAAMAAIKAAREAGMIVTANSQLNRLNMNHLPEIAAMLEEAGVRVWRCQVTVPMGRAADRPEWILEPFHIKAIMDTLAELQVAYAEKAKAEGKSPRQIFNIASANNLGYYGPHEILLRSSPGTKASWWQGCQAGRYTIGIESDGTVKGCPSLPTAPYTGGKVRDIPLDTIWKSAPELQFVRDRGVSELWGFCKTCYYADECRAGCSFTTHCTLGKRGNNPFCYHRVAELEKQGKRERLRSVVAPEGIPYDFGRFEIVEEDIPADAAAK